MRGRCSSLWPPARYWRCSPPQSQHLPARSQQQKFERRNGRFTLLHGIPVFPRIVYCRWDIIGPDLLALISSISQQKQGLLTCASRRTGAVAAGTKAPAAGSLSSSAPLPFEGARRTANGRNVTANANITSVGNLSGRRIY